MGKLSLVPTVLGQKLAEYDRLREKGKTEDRIIERMKEDAEQFEVTLEEYQKALGEIKTKSGSSGVSLKKEAWRQECDRLTDNWLYQNNNVPVNPTPDQAIQFCKDLLTARNDLLEFDQTYQKATGYQDSQRDDWRIFHCIGQVAEDKNSFCRVKANWNDGSKKDRNQYSNGRLYPVAKSSGMVKEQELPVLTGQEVEQPVEQEQEVKAEQPEQPVKKNQNKKKS